MFTFVFVLQATERRVATHLLGRLEAYPRATEKMAERSWFRSIGDFKCRL
jgi:hypothetical protein